MRNKSGAIAAAAAASLLLVGCAGQPTGSPRHAAPAQPSASTAPSPSASPAPAFMLDDNAKKTGCPAHSPRSAQCFRITLTGTLAHYGRLRSGGWLDVEVPQTSADCGKPWTYTERLRTRTGSLVVRATGPRLCLDTVITVSRHYTVIRGTGSLRGLHGHGVITLAVLSVGAAETWTLPAR